MWFLSCGSLICSNVHNPFLLYVDGGTSRLNIFIFILLLLKLQRLIKGYHYIVALNFNYSVQQHWQDHTMTIYGNEVQMDIRVTVVGNSHAQ